VVALAVGPVLVALAGALGGIHRLGLAKLGGREVKP
jgi:hypothetical protein